VRRTLLPSLEIEKEIDALLAGERVDVHPLEVVSELGRLGVRLVLQRAVEEEVDKCIECGMCEPKCPSRDLTLTPRQRIVVRREMARLTESRGDGQLLTALEADFPYMALDTCAVDGLCATACPVGIDTGQLTKRFRRLRHSPAAQTRARRLAENFALLEGMARVGLRTGHMIQSLFGAGAMTGVTRALRAVADPKRRQILQMLKEKGFQGAEATHEIKEVAGDS